MSARWTLLASTKDPCPFDEAECKESNNYNNNTTENRKRAAHQAQNENYCEKCEMKSAMNMELSWNHIEREQESEDRERKRRNSLEWHFRHSNQILHRHKHMHTTTATQHPPPATIQSAKQLNNWIACSNFVHSCCVFVSNCYSWQSAVGFSLSKFHAKKKTERRKECVFTESHSISSSDSSLPLVKLVLEKKKEEQHEILTSFSCVFFFFISSIDWSNRIRFEICYIVMVCSLQNDLANFSASLVFFFATIPALSLLLAKSHEKKTTNSSWNI